MNLENTVLLLLALSIRKIVCGKGAESSSSRSCSLGRIVGGNDAPSETWYPSIVHLNTTGCAATILSQVWLLTVAHCEVQEGALVVAGNPFKCSDAKYEQIQKVAKVFAHEKYNRSEHFNDIELLQLDEPLKLTPGVQRVKLLPSDYKIPDMKISTVVGWGSTDAARSSDSEMWPQRLQHVDVPILANETCAKILDDDRTYEYHLGMICAGFLGTGGKDSCQGDSGGPLYITESGNPPSKSPSKTHFQVGIVSFGTGCARPDDPGVYTKVQFYLDWIEKTMKENPHRLQSLLDSQTSGGVQNTFCAFTLILMLVF